MRRNCKRSRRGDLVQVSPHHLIQLAQNTRTCMRTIRFPSLALHTPTVTQTTRSEAQRPNIQPLPYNRRFPPIPSRKHCSKETRSMNTGDAALLLYHPWLSLKEGTVAIASCLVTHNPYINLASLSRNLICFLQAVGIWRRNTACVWCFARLASESE